jgi:hypothetical protein
MAEEARLAGEARLQRLGGLPVSGSPGAVDLAGAALEVLDERPAGGQHSAPPSSEEGNQNATSSAAAPAEARGSRDQHTPDEDDHVASATELLHSAGRDTASYSEDEVDVAAADDGQRRIDAEHTSPSAMSSELLGEVAGTPSNRFLGSI